MLYLFFPLINLLLFFIFFSGKVKCFDSKEQDFLAILPILINNICTTEINALCSEPYLLWY